MLKWKRSDKDPCEAQAPASAGVYLITKCKLPDVDMLQLEYVTTAGSKLLGAAVREGSLYTMAEEHEQDLLDRDNAAKAKPGEFLFLIAEILEVTAPNKYKIGPGTVTVHPKEYAELLMRFMRLNIGGDDVQVGKWESPATEIEEATPSEAGSSSVERSAS